MKNVFIKILLNVFLFLVCVQSAKATCGVPGGRDSYDGKVTVHFEKDNQKIKAPVQFKMTCYGKNEKDKEGKFKIFEWSNECAGMACTYRHYLYLFAVVANKNGDNPERFEVTTCDIEGKVQNNGFLIKDFLGPDMSKLDCRQDIHKKIKGSSCYYDYECDIKVNIPSEDQH